MAPTPTSTACLRYDTVKAGDTCGDISLRDAITQYNLIKLNPNIGEDCSGLIAGNGICVDSSLNNCSKVVAFKSGQGCYDVAEAAGIPLDTFLKLNPDIDADCSNVQADQVVCTAPRTGSSGGSDVLDCTRQYVVQVADTCNKIAAKLSLTSTQLLGINPDMSCSSLRAGDRICAYSPSTNFCPELRHVKSNETCYSLATNASMSLQQWQSVNTYNRVGIDCDVLPVNDIVCQATGNASLPDQPTGENPTSLPLCSTCNYNSHCCTQFSMCAPLPSDLCTREKGVSPSTSTSPKTYSL